MKITRLYTGSDGESHFSDIEIPLEDTGIRGRRSQLMKATGIFFRETGKEYDLDWHPAPRRQFILSLSGKGEIEVGDGTKRQFGPGDILLVEDTTGHGHLSRNVGNKPRVVAFVPLD